MALNSIYERLKYENIYLSTGNPFKYFIPIHNTSEITVYWQKQRQRFTRLLFDSAEHEYGRLYN